MSGVWSRAEHRRVHWQSSLDLSFSDSFIELAFIEVGADVCDHLALSLLTLEIGCRYSSLYHAVYWQVASYAIFVLPACCWASLAIALGVRVSCEMQ